MQHGNNPYVGWHRFDLVDQLFGLVARGLREKEDPDAYQREIDLVKEALRAKDLASSGTSTEVSQQGAGGEVGVDVD